MIYHEGPIHQSSPLDSTGHVQEPDMIQPNLSDIMDALQASPAGSFTEGLEAAGINGEKTE